MASRRIAVDITGDPTDLQRALDKAEAAIKGFGSSVKSNLVTDPVSKLDKSLDTLDQKIRLRSRRASSVGPLRIAGLGLGAGTALFAATQAVGRLGDALDVTGEKAYTNEGRLRNFGSSLLSGDIVGGLQKLGEIPKTLDEAGISADDAKKHYEDFKAFAAEGGAFGALAQQAVDLADATRLAAAAQDALNNSLRTTTILASGAVISGGVAPRDEGPGSPGQVAADRAARGATGGTGRQGARDFRPLAPSTKTAAALALAQARGNLPEVLRLQKLEAARLRGIFPTHGNTKQRAAATLAIAAAEADAIATQKQMDADALAAAKAKDAEAKRRAAEAKRAAEKARREAEAARKKAAKAVQDALDKQKDLDKALQKRATAILDAAITALSRKQEKRDIAREIEEKSAQLALAQRIGSPTAIKQARGELQDARNDRLRFMLEGAKVRPDIVNRPGGPRAVAGGGVTVHIGNISLPGVTNAAQLLRQLQRIPVATSRRGHHGGTKHGI